MNKTKQNENAIIDFLLNTVISAGLCVTVFDGEEVMIRRSTDIAAIKETMGETESDFIRIFKQDTPYQVGSIHLVYDNGNDGIDLISDYSSNSLEEMEALLLPVEQFVETL